MAKAKSLEVSIPNPPTNDGATGLVQDGVIARLVPDPASPPDVIALEGFLGRSARPKFWRLYQTLDLKNYVEIAEGDIVHSEPLETKLQPLGGTVIWVKSGARLQHTRSESHLAEAEFMQGDLASRFLPGTGTECLRRMVGGPLLKPPTWWGNCPPTKFYHGVYHDCSPI